MTRLFLTLIFCLGAAGAAGAAAPATPVPQRVPTTQAKPEIVQAALVIPGNAAMRTTAPQSAERDAPGPSVDDIEETGEHHSMLMLLAALALMIGIALRRWGAGEQ